MNTPLNRQLGLFTLTSVLFIAALTSVAPQQASGSWTETAPTANCETRDDVIRAAERSWHGVSLTCNEAVFRAQQQ